MAVNAAITNELARVVGLLATQHPEHSVRIEWRENESESVWFVTVDNGADERIFIVDDETGTHAPLTTDELARYRAGERVFETA